MSKARRSSPLEKMPSIPEIRARLSVVLREADALRKMLRVAQKIRQSDAVRRAPDGAQ
jgi:hypothetical protein